MQIASFAKPITMHTIQIERQALSQAKKVTRAGEIMVNYSFTNHKQKAKTLRIYYEA